MGRIWLAFKTFFVVLFSRDTANRIRDALSDAALSKSNLEATSQHAPNIATAKPTAALAPKRSEAITLLAALQREARFVDLVTEPLDSYSDEQIGAAARNVLRDCAVVLNRFFELRPVVTQPEGEMLDVPAGYDAARFRVVGNATGSPPFRGRVVHPGWEAATISLPVWSGSNEAARVVAAAEVEI